MTQTENVSPGPADAQPAKEEKKKKEDKKAKKTGVKFESTMPLEEAISYFEAIISGMKKGTISLKQDGNTIKLSPPPHLSVEVKAASKGERERISFELQWQTAGTSDLTISSE